jgi:hypothetical protein
MQTTEETTLHRIQWELKTANDRLLDVGEKIESSLVHAVTAANARSLLLHEMQNLREVNAQQQAQILRLVGSLRFWVVIFVVLWFANTDLGRSFVHALDAFMTGAWAFLLGLWHQITGSAH